MSSSSMAASGGRRATGRASTASSRRLRALEADETLLVQSGKPVGVFRTHADAPRVLIANSNLVPAWATWEHFHELDRKGLMMYGQMTAGSWIYIGSQGIVQGTYETFAEVGRQHYGGDLAGRWILTGGLGGMGGAQPLAATMAGASMLAVECQPRRIEMRLRTQLPRSAGERPRRSAGDDRAIAPGQASRFRSACSAMPPRSFPSSCAGGIKPGRRHRPDLGARPAQRLSAGRLDARRVGGAARARPEGARSRRRKRSMAVQVEAMLDFQAPGRADARLRQQHPPDGAGRGRRGRVRRFRASCRPISARCSAAASARSAGCALSGDPEDIYRTDAQREGADPRRSAPAQLARHGARAHRLPGPAGAHLLGRPRPAPPARPRLQRDGGDGRGQGADRHRPRPPRFGLGRKPEPRDRGDAGRLRRGLRLAAAQRAAQHAPRGATWVSLHHGGGVGMGYSQHAGMVIVADGTAEAARRLERVLWNDPATGVMRHADAGYEEAIACAREQGLKLPGLV